MSQDKTSPARGTRDIESELAATRVRIEHTLELLEDRFRPSAILDQTWHYARSKRQDGGTTRLQETVVNNPLPVVLMGVGLAWLLVSGRSGSVPQSDSPLTEGATGDTRANNGVAGQDRAESVPDRPVSTRNTSASAHTATPSKPAASGAQPDHIGRRHETNTTSGDSSAAAAHKPAAGTADDSCASNR